MKKQFLIYIFIVTTSIASAQLFEAGAFVGGSNYIGDLGSTAYINPNKIAYGLVGKFNFTPRITFRGTAIYTNLKFDDTKSNDPFRVARGIKHSNRILEGAVGIEFSFLKYSLTKTGYTHTPYIIAQVGAVNYSTISDDGSPKRIISVAFPFGAGYKMRLAENVGIAFETSFRYTFKDTIDGNNHNLAFFNFGDPNDNDWYVFTGITVVYGFGRRSCYKERF